MPLFTRRKETKPHSSKRQLSLKATSTLQSHLQPRTGSLLPGWCSSCFCRSRWRRRRLRRAAAGWRWGWGRCWRLAPHLRGETERTWAAETARANFALLCRTSWTRFKLEWMRSAQLAGRRSAPSEGATPCDAPGGNNSVIETCESLHYNLAREHELYAYVL